MAVLYRDTYYGKENEASITDADRIIYECIRQNPSRDYDHILSKCNDWYIYRHLSVKRESLLNWYPIEPDASILEIGGEFGALTGAYCRRCKRSVILEPSLFKSEAIQMRFSDVDNLAIYPCDLFDFSSEERFDVIILAGRLADAAGINGDMRACVAVLSRCMELLKPEGRLLIAEENRYGIRYICGGIGENVTLPFAGINRHKKGIEGYSFSRAEMAGLIEEAGFTEYNFFYPLPDYRFPQMVYSDQYLPQKGLRGRLIPYFERTGNLVSDERELYDDFIENGVFPFYANSFLIECSRKDLSHICYCAMTTERVRKYAGITVIFDDKTVTKQYLYSQGKAGFKELCTNLEAIRSRGIPTVPYTVECSSTGSESMVMPFIEAPSGISVLEKLIAENRKEEFLDLFDKLYETIRDSSEYVSSEENRLFVSEHPELDWGVILKKAYTEMIPNNCFYIDGEFCFYDQEFCEPCFPAKYVLYRAVKYTYFFLGMTENWLPMEQLKKRYGLLEVWRYCEEQEAVFISRLQKYNVNQLWNQRWAAAGQIRKNEYILMGTSNDLKQKIRQELEAERVDKKYKVGYMAGVYDLFHIGHLNLIKKAKTHCDYLIVGVLKDELVVYFKNNLPFIPFEERIEIVRAIKEVDLAVAVDFSNIGKMDSWKLYRFDCQFSGSDYAKDPGWLEDQRKLREVGSDIKFFPYTETTSSSQLKRLIRIDMEESGQTKN